MADLPLSNAEMVAEMVIGATINDTVTPANPTPPTNIPSTGFTPPSTAAVAAPADSATWGDPDKLATTTVGGGMLPESAGDEGDSTLYAARWVTTVLYTTTPNRTHPSSPDYTGPTISGAMDDGGDQYAYEGDRIEGDAEYADEEAEDEEEDALEAAKEQGKEKPKRKPGRPKGSKRSK